MSLSLTRWFGCLKVEGDLFHNLRPLSREIMLHNLADTHTQLNPGKKEKKGVIPSVGTGSEPIRKVPICRILTRECPHYG